MGRHMFYYANEANQGAPVIDGTAHVLSRSPCYRCDGCSTPIRLIKEPLLSMGRHMFYANKSNQGAPVIDGTAHVLRQ
jgi:hypothetical protein